MWRCAGSATHSTAPWPTCPACTPCFRWLSDSNSWVTIALVRSRTSMGVRVLGRTPSAFASGAARRQRSRRVLFARQVYSTTTISAMSAGCRDAGNRSATALSTQWRRGGCLALSAVRSALLRRPKSGPRTAFYLSRYAANIPHGTNPVAHFLAVGGTAGFDPHPLFDSTWYLSLHPELRESRQNPLIHYLTEGWRQGAAPHPQFDGALYLQNNPDVNAAGINPLDHFVRHGQSEGRAQPLPQRNVSLVG